MGWENARARSKNQTEKKQTRPRTDPSWPLLRAERFRDENRRQKTRRPRSLAEEKKNISPSHRRSISPPNSHTNKSVREKIKNNKNNLRPYLFARAFATGFLSAETDRADCVVAENIMRADLWRSRLCTFVYISRKACARVLIGKKNPPLLQKVFFSSFLESRERSPFTRGDWRERDLFFLPIKIPLKTLNSTRKVSGFEHPPWWYAHHHKRTHRHHLQNKQLWKKRFIYRRRLLV